MRLFPEYKYSLSLEYSVNFALATKNVEHEQNIMRCDSPV